MRQAPVHQTKLFSWTAPASTNQDWFNLHFKSKPNFISPGQARPGQPGPLDPAGWCDPVIRWALKPFLSLCDAAASLASDNHHATTTHHPHYQISYLDILVAITHITFTWSDQSACPLSQHWDLSLQRQATTAQWWPDRWTGSTSWSHLSLSPPVKTTLEPRAGLSVLCGRVNMCYCYQHHHHTTHHSQHHNCVFFFIHPPTLVLRTRAITSL